MIMQTIGRLLGGILLAVYIVAFEFFILHQNEKANFRFEVGMLKDINKVGRELKETELEDKTIQIIKGALERVQWNVQRYTEDMFFWQFLSFVLLVPVIAVFVLPTPTSQKIKLWK